MLTTVSTQQQLNYAQAALDSVGTAAAIADANDQLIWSTPAFDRFAEPTLSISPQELLTAMLNAIDAEGLRDQTSHDAHLASLPPFQVSVQSLPDADQRLVIAQSKNRAGQPHGGTGLGYASLDSLTGLPDRAAFKESLARRFKSPRPFALLFIDVNDFKQVNDTLGHLAGDDALMELAARMRKAVREHDFLARFGGDEFVAMIEAVDSLAELEPLLERLRVAVAEPLVLGDHVRQVSVSIGSALSADRYESCQAMLHAADLNMYATRWADPSRRSLAPSF